MRWYRERQQGHNWGGCLSSQPCKRELRQGRSRKADHTDHRPYKYRLHARFDYPGDNLQSGVQLDWRHAPDDRGHRAIRKCYRCRDAADGGNFDRDNYRPRQRWSRAGGGKSFRYGGRPRTADFREQQFGSIRDNRRWGHGEYESVDIEHRECGPDNLRDFRDRSPIWGERNYHSKDNQRWPIRAGGLVVSANGWRGDVWDLIHNEQRSVKSDNERCVDRDWLNSSVRAIASESDFSEFWQPQHRRHRDAAGHVEQHRNVGRPNLEHRGKRGWV